MPEIDRFNVTDSASEFKPRRLLGGPVETDGSLVELVVFRDFNPYRGVDGRCLEVAGNFVATAGWAGSAPDPLDDVFNPDGRVLETHPVPNAIPTNCAIGSLDHRDFSITGGSGRLHRPRTDLAGLLGPSWNRRPFLPPAPPAARCNRFRPPGVDTDV